MTVRSLGDWSPLDLDSDPVYADPDVVSAAQKRYDHIATTIDDATAKLKQIVETNSDSLAGQYVEGLKSEAGSLKDRLSKAAVRYHDVANEIKKYEPDLDTGLTETAGALTDAEAAQTAQTKAQAMPDPQKGSDGTTSPEEQQKGNDKNKANSDADAKMTAAKTRLNNALDALNVAGKRFGDAVNSKKYDDGLSDTYKDKLDAVMAKISQYFAIIGMILGVLAILIPGVNLLVFAGVVAGAITLVANIVLYVDGKGSVLDVVLGAVGLGLAGLGALASVIGKGISSIAKTTAIANRGDGGIELVPLRPPPGNSVATNFSRPFGPGNPRPFGPGNPRPGGPPPNYSKPFGSDNVPSKPLPEPEPTPPPGPNAAADWTNQSEWFNNPVTNWLISKFGGTTPDSGFWSSFLSQGKSGWADFLKVFSDPVAFGKNIGLLITGMKGPLDLSAIVGAAGLGKISPLWFVWGGLNGAFGIGAGWIYTGGRLMQWIPAVNPPGQAA